MNGPVDLRRRYSLRRSRVQSNITVHDHRTRAGGRRSGHDREIPRRSEVDGCGTRAASRCTGGEVPRIRYDTSHKRIPVEVLDSGRNRGCVLGAGREIGRRSKRCDLTRNVIHDSAGHRASVRSLCDPERSRRDRQRIHRSAESCVDRRVNGNTCGDVGRICERYCGSRVVKGCSSGKVPRIRNAPGDQRVAGKVFGSV